MTKDGKDKEICSICMNNDEEDMLLIAKAFLTTFDNFKHWSREDYASKVKEMFRMINFKKLLDVIIGDKHLIDQKCRHKRLEEKIINFLYDVFKETGAMPYELPSTKKVNALLKKKWKKILEVKTQIYEIESEFTQLNKRCLKSDFGIDSSVKKKLKVNNSKDIFSMSTKKGTESTGNKGKKNLPKSAVKILREWFLENIKHPYPDYKTKLFLSKITGLSMNQIQNWFINSRKRFLGPMKSSKGESSNKQSEPQASVSPQPQIPVPSGRGASVLNPLQFTPSPNIQSQQGIQGMPPQFYQHGGGQFHPLFPPSNQMMMPQYPQQVGMNPYMSFDPQAQTTSPSLAINVTHLEDNSQMSQTQAEMMRRMHEYWLKSNPFVPYYLNKGG